MRCWASPASTWWAKVSAGLGAGFVAGVLRAALLMRRFLPRPWRSPAETVGCCFRKPAGPDLTPDHEAPTMVTKSKQPRDLRRG
ncbi:hypothetical protein GCM10010345_64850 [Streptomyces canarius]|uniref:Uncharacterized protein n=1 Tax=Streptomyces canarius TaxID=285453 RepID=A0ABQ3D0U7_9ACTN|nr:hypothetical protein GCM10010345_64850 [Streptomyces canarius]